MKFSTAKVFLGFVNIFFFQQLHLTTHAATTKASMQPTASILSLDKAQSDVIEKTWTLDGIALLVLLVTQRCPLHVHLCVVVVRMHQDGSKDNILLLQTVKLLVKFAIIGQAIVVDGKTTLKSRTAAPFTCMSCKKRLHARFDTVVSIKTLLRHTHVRWYRLLLYYVRIPSLIEPLNKPDKCQLDKWSTANPIIEGLISWCIIISCL